MKTASILLLLFGLLCLACNDKDSSIFTNSDSNTPQLSGEASDIQETFDLMGWMAFLIFEVSFWGC